MAYQDQEHEAKGILIKFTAITCAPRGAEGGIVADKIPRAGCADSLSLVPPYCKPRGLE